MAYATTIPVLGGLAILATVTGVSLGRSAVAEINPIHFKPSTSQFYSDLVPYRSSGSVQPDLGGRDYFQADYAYSAEPPCGACDDYPVDFRPARDKSIEALDADSSAKSTAELSLAAAEARTPEPPPANRQWIERYTTYTIVTEVVDPPASAAPVPDES